MPSKKTGLFLNAVSEEIVNRVMAEQGFTKISNVVNFIIQEYDKLIKEPKKVETEEVVETQIKHDLSGWFVAKDE